MTRLLWYPTPSALELIAAQLPLTASAGEFHVRDEALLDSPLATVRQPYNELDRLSRIRWQLDAIPQIVEGVRAATR